MELTPLSLFFPKFEFRKKIPPGFPDKSPEKVLSFSTFIPVLGSLKHAEISTHLMSKLSSDELNTQGAYIPSAHILAKLLRALGDCKIAA